MFEAVGRLIIIHVERKVELKFHLYLRGVVLYHNGTASIVIRFLYAVMWFLISFKKTHILCFLTHLGRRGLGGCA